MTIGSILLSAGQGKRLRPITNDKAKPALPVLDVPLGAWGLAALVNVAPPVVVNTSHGAQTLETALRAAIPEGWESFYEGDEGFGTAGTIAALSDRVSDDIVVYNGDMISDVDLEALRNEHQSSGADITLAVETVESKADLALGDGWVKAFIDRRRANEPGARYIGVAIITANAAKSIPRTQPLGFGESVLAPLATNGRLRAYFHRGYELDVGTVDRYLRANHACLDGKAPPPPIPFPGSIVEVDGGRAYVGPEARADEASLGPGAVILRGATVHSGARVENAVVYENEVVPAGTEIANGVWFEGAFVSSVEKT